MSCITPDASLGMVKFELLAGDIVVSNSLEFEFVQPLELFTIEPSSSAPSGGTEAVLHGGGFFDSGYLACKFGDTIVKATYRTQTSILCTTPPKQDHSTVRVSVTANGVDYSAGSVNMTYSNTIELVSLDPSQGPRAEGTIVNVTGQNFSPTGELSCLFDVVPVPAVYYSDTMIQCRIPDLRHNLDSIQVSA